MFGILIGYGKGRTVSSNDCAHIAKIDGRYVVMARSADDDHHFESSLGDTWFDDLEDALRYASGLGTEYGVTFLADWERV